MYTSLNKKGEVSMNSTIHKDSQMSVAYKQFKDKLYHNSFAFFQLIALQTLGYLFSLSSGMTGIGDRYLMLSIRHINPIPIFIMSILWIIIQAFNFSGEKRQEYYMVSNNFTAYFSDIAVLEVYSVLIGVTMVFSGPMLQLLGSVSLGGGNISVAYESMTVFHYLSLFITSTLYSLLFGSAAYFIGILRVRYQSFFVIGSIAIILLLIAWSLLAIRFFGVQYTISVESILGFYVQESSVALWLLKTIGSIAGLYGLTWLGIKNLEVNR